MIARKRRQNLLAECLNEAELPPSYLMAVDFAEPHVGILRKPGGRLSQIGRNKDGLPYLFRPWHAARSKLLALNILL
jgi:hypothetical protein